MPRTSPLVAEPEDFRLFDAAVTNQTQPESIPSLMGSVAGGLLPVIHLTPGQATASRPGMELGVVRESVSDDFVRCVVRWTKFRTRARGPAL